VVNQIRLSLQGCQNEENKKFLLEIKDFFKLKHPQIWEDTNQLYDQILKLGMSPFEYWMEKLTTILKNHFEQDENPEKLMV